MRGMTFIISCRLSNIFINATLEQTPMSQTNTTEQKANNPENLNLKPSLGARVKDGIFQAYYWVASCAVFAFFCLSVYVVSEMGGAIMDKKLPSNRLGKFHP